MGDILTIFLSFVVGICTTHASLRARCFLHVISSYCTTEEFVYIPVLGATQLSTATSFMQIWYFVDFLLNFIFTSNECNTESFKQMPQRKYMEFKNILIWFMVDIISIVPWDVIFFQPILIDNHRKSIVRKVSDIVRAYHFFRTYPVITGRWRQLLHLLQLARSRGLRPLRLIKFIPLYNLYFGSMKLVLVVRFFWLVRKYQQLYGSIMKSLYRR